MSASSSSQSSSSTTTDGAPFPLDKILNLVEKSRFKSLSSGNYEQSVKSYEQCIRLLTKYAPTQSDKSVASRLQELKARLQLELNVLCDLHTEFSAFPRAPTGPSSNNALNFGGDQHANNGFIDNSEVNNDPEVWKAPSSAANNNGNLFGKAIGGNSRNAIKPTIAYMPTEDTILPTAVPTEDIISATGLVWVDLAV